LNICVEEQWLQVVAVYEKVMIRYLQLLIVMVAVGTFATAELIIKYDRPCFGELMSQRVQVVGW
jgi:hypothetical protein